jgi:hypothetical protein
LPRCDQFGSNPHSMRVRFPLGMVVALVLIAAGALAQTAPSPTLAPALSPSPPSGPQAASTPPPMNLISPMPSASAPGQPQPPINVPAPQSAPLLAPPPIPPHLPNASGAPDPAQELKAIPQVEVWRAGATKPQTLRRRRHFLGRGFIAGPAPVFVQLHFDLSKAGKTVAVTADPGVSYDPPDAFLRIRPTGDCALTVKLDESFHEGSMTFSCGGVTSVLRLSHAPASLVDSLEASNTSGGQ